MTISQFLQQLERPVAGGLFFLLQERCLRLMDAFLQVQQEPSSPAGNLAHELSFLWVRD